MTTLPLMILLLIPSDTAQSPELKLEELYTLAHTYLAYGDTQGAINVVQRIEQETGATVRSRRLLGDIQLSQRNYEAALVEYLWVIEREPRDIELVERIAILFYDPLGNEDKALAWFESLVRLDPDNIRAWHILGYHALIENDRERAEFIYARLLDIDPDDTRAQRGAEIAADVHKVSLQLWQDVMPITTTTIEPRTHINLNVDVDSRWRVGVRAMTNVYASREHALQRFTMVAPTISYRFADQSRIGISPIFFFTESGFLFQLELQPGLAFGNGLVLGGPLGFGFDNTGTCNVNLGPSLGFWLTPDLFVSGQFVANGFCGEPLNVGGGAMAFWRVTRKTAVRAGFSIGGAMVRVEDQFAEFQSNVAFWGIDYQLFRDVWVSVINEFFWRGGNGIFDIETRISTGLELRWP